MDKIEQLIQREEISLASNNQRLLSYAIDDLIVSLLVVIIFWEPITASESVEVAINVINQAVLYVVLLKIAYQTFFISYYGQTVGKIVLKLRVISIDTLDNPNLAVSFLRAFMRIFSEMFFYLGFLLAFFLPYRQTLHDKIAKTLVINV